jgi:hypothetical protein
LRALLNSAFEKNDKSIQYVLTRISAVDCANLRSGYANGARHVV